MKNHGIITQLIKQSAQGIMYLGLCHIRNILRIKYVIQAVNLNVLSKRYIAQEDEQQNSSFHKKNLEKKELEKTRLQFKALDFEKKNIKIFLSDQ